MLKNLCLLVSCLLISAAVFAQSAPSGEGPWRNAPVWIGAEISTFNPDYGCESNSPFSCWKNQLVGVASYAYASDIYKLLGAEGEARLLHWSGPRILTQTSYLAGPRIGMLRYKRLLLDGKFLVGEGRIKLTGNLAGSGAYIAFAPGFVIDYRVARRISTRVEYEYQRWPSFKGDGSGKGGLTPNGLSFGLSYMILR